MGTRFVLNIPSSITSQSSSLLFHFLLLLFFLFSRSKVSIKKKMLFKFRSPFKLEEDHDSPNKPNRSLSCNNKTSYETDIVVGLRIVEQISSQGDQNQQSNVVVKSAVRLSQPTLNNSALEYSCFLKTCNLCNKDLSPDKEVYMYRYVLVTNSFLVTLFGNPAV